MAPTNPGLVPIIAGNTHSAEVAVQENAHKEYLHECKEYKAVCEVILQLTTNVFESKYLRYLCNQHTACNNTIVL